MKKKPEPLVIPASFAKVAAAFARSKDVVAEKGWGQGTACLKTGGKIFAMLVRGELVAKLPRARVDELVAGGDGARFDPRRDGRVMKEWIVVAEGGPSWVEVAREAHAFVKGQEG